MARVVCQVLHRPGRLTFVWSEGAAFFEPYHLEGQELAFFYEAARTARAVLARATVSESPQSAHELAQAGYDLYQAIFRTKTKDPQAHEVEQWLQNLRAANNVEAIDLLGDKPGVVPWNVVYDCVPLAEQLRSGDPAGLKPFWGFQYSLGVGKRVNPLRVGCVLDSPTILLVADGDLLEQLPGEQKNLLGDWAIAHELTVVDSIEAMAGKLRQEAPDILYLFGRLTGAALYIGEENITPRQISELLLSARAGNPDPVVFLQVGADTDNTVSESGLASWQAFLMAATSTLAGAVLCEVPVTPAQANSFGVEALTRFVQNQGLGDALKQARVGQGLAALAYTRLLSVACQNRGRR